MRKRELILFLLVVFLFSSIIFVVGSSPSASQDAITNKGTTPQTRHFTYPEATAAYQSVKTCVDQNGYDGQSVACFQHVNDLLKTVEGEQGACVDVCNCQGSCSCVDACITKYSGDKSGDILYGRDVAISDWYAAHNVPSQQENGSLGTTPPDNTVPVETGGDTITPLPASPTSILSHSFTDPTATQLADAIIKNGGLSEEQAAALRGKIASWKADVKNTPAGEAITVAPPQGISGPSMFAISNEPISSAITTITTIDDSQTVLLFQKSMGSSGFPISTPPPISIKSFIRAARQIQGTLFKLCAPN